MISALLLAGAAGAADLTICADRPSKANAACTVPTGHWQLEVSAVDWARTSDAGARTDITSFGQALAKLGLSADSDIEFGVTPHIAIESRAGTTRDRATGIGDVVVRYKRRLTNSDAATQLTLIPFFKMPTAQHQLGNGKVEGGLASTLTFATKAGPTISVGPELDVLADSDGRGYHAGVTNLVNIGISPAPRLSLSAELWNAINFDHPRTVRSWSADVAAAYLPSKRLQIDGGANFGLNRSTADVELYVGASMLF